MDQYFQSFKNNITDPNIIFLSEAADDPNRSMTGTTQNKCFQGKCQVPITLSGIWDYGCWCNFGENLLDGSGQAVSEYDEICKKLQLCLRCSKIDNESLETCDPKTTDYEVDFGWLKSEQAILSDCTKNNPNSYCQQNVCTCEMNLISSLLNLMWSGVVYEDKFKHEKGWDPNLPGRCEKAKNVGQVNKVKACCGYYPNRMPYGGDLECCEEVQVRYNPYVSTCCGGLGVYGIGVGCE